MTFEQKKYQVIRQAISSELADFIFSYFVLQRDAVGYMVKHKWINPRNPFVGKWTDKQVPGAYSKYGDWAMETLLQYVRPVMMERTGLDLVPTYSYARIYEKGNILWRHKDRPSCEISTTLNLGGMHGLFISILRVQIPLSGLMNPMIPEEQELKSNPMHLRGYR